ncbi:hypothetical protein BsWGS_29034 [Bradybaena similaris]
MRTVRFYWVKFVIVSLGLIALTVAATMYFTSRCSASQTANMGIGVELRENEEDSEFMQEVLTEDYQPMSPPTRGPSSTKNNQRVMIRRPKLHDLDPQPVDWPIRDVASMLNLAEVPASRPPKCILLGFAKCGTMALLEFLDLHPKIVSVDWEVDYFCDRVYPKYALRWYVQRMPPSFSDQITIEKSPCYIVEHDAHLRIHAMNSSMKVMVIIRDPITRLLSEYGHYLSIQTYWGRPAASFKTRIYNSNTQQFREHVLKVADYSPHFEHLLRVFPRDQILIVDGDKLVTNPLSQTRRVEKFLGLEHAITEDDVFFDTEKGFYCMKLKNSQEAKCLGSNKGRKHAEIDQDIKEKLIDYIRTYNEKFFQLVGQRFDWLQ